MRAAHSHVCCGGRVLVGLELPEAFGVRMAVTKVAQPEEGEIGEYDQEAEASRRAGGRGKEAGLRAAAVEFSDGSSRAFCCCGQWVGGRREALYLSTDWIGCDMVLIDIGLDLPYFSPEMGCHWKQMGWNGKGNRGRYCRGAIFKFDDWGHHDISADAFEAGGLGMAKQAKVRCGWAESDAGMRAYHDEEWGVPERDGRAFGNC